MLWWLPAPGAHVMQFNIINIKITIIYKGNARSIKHLIYFIRQVLCNGCPGPPFAYGDYLQYIPRNMHTVFALLCFVVVIHWLIFLYPSGLLHWHCGNLTIAPVPAKQSWWIWINTSYEFIMNDCITTTKQTTTKPCAYFLGYTVHQHRVRAWISNYIHVIEWGAITQLLLTP